MAIAFAVRPPDAAWAHGRAWRGVNPTVVDRFGHGGLPPDERPAFAQLRR